MFRSMEEILVVLRNLEHENQTLCEFIAHFQTNQVSTSLDVFQEHNPDQRSHRSTYFTSLMAHVQSFNVLSIKCVWPSGFILIDIQLAQLKLDSVAPCCQAWPLFGLHLCWSINHSFSTSLKCFLKSSMPPLEIPTNNTHIASRYDLFLKNHVQLWYMHWSSNNQLAIFHGVRECS